MHTLETVIRNRISTGLKRHAITRPSQWSEQYRVMGQPFPGNYSFKHHPWTREMHDCTSPLMIGKKAAQVGYTEVALNKAFYTIDIKAQSVLYVLPNTHPDAGDFSSSRFDVALDLSPHLENMFSDTKNVGHKRAGTANLYIRGSKSRAQLKSIAVSLIIADELEEMNQDNINLLPERMAGQFDKQQFYLSTPIVKNMGIDAFYNSTTMEHYFFKCPKCSKLTELTFPECLVITAENHYDDSVYDSYLQCKECHNRLEHENKIDWVPGQWVAKYPGRINRGFHIPQLYSATSTPAEIAISYLKARDDPAAMQEFKNSKLGMTHEEVDARVTKDMIKNCKGSYLQKSASKSGIVTIGVDVGKKLHYEIDEWFLKQSNIDVNESATPKLLKEGEVDSFQDIAHLFQVFNCTYGVVDANPERRMAINLCNTFFGRFKRCFYTEVKKPITIDEEDHAISVDRSYWMDQAFFRFKKKDIRLPQNLSNQYMYHLIQPVRIMKKDKDGNPKVRYLTAEGIPDHLAHARVYSEIALFFALRILSNRDTGKVL